MKEFKGTRVPWSRGIGKLTHTVINTTIRVENPTYNLKTIAEEKGKELHRSTRVAKSKLRIEQSHQQK